AAPVRDREVEGRIERVDLSFETGHGRLVGSRPALELAGLPFVALPGRRRVVHELAVASHRDAGAGAGVPDVALRRGVDVAVGVGNLPGAFQEVRPATAAVVHGPDLLHRVGRVGPGGVGVAVVADFRVDVKVVQKDELAGEGVRVGSDVLPVEAEVRIAVAL